MSETLILALLGVVFVVGFKVWFYKNYEWDSYFQRYEKKQNKAVQK